MDIEAAIGCGQVEQLVEQAKNELILIPEYASWYGKVLKSDALSIYNAHLRPVCRRLWESPPASLDDDDFSDVYDDLEFIDPDAVSSAGLRELALKKRAEVEAQRRAAAASAAAAAAAPAGATKTA